MSETTNQMSLLDAIGLSAPEGTKKAKKDARAKVETAAVKPKKKKPDKPKAKSVDRIDETQPASEPVEKVTDATSSKAEEIVAEAPNTEQIKELSPATDSGPLTLDKHLCFALYSANHAMHGVYKVLLKEAGLTYPQYLAMTVLWETNNVPVGAITSKLQLDTNTLTPLLKRLEAMGLVTRTRNTKDERQVLLKLTRKGRSLQKKTEHFSSSVFSSTGLQLEEIVDLQSKIMKLRDNLREAGVVS